MKDSRITIRNLDVQLWKEARMEALKVGKTIGQWLNEAFEEKLRGNK
jgi:hypothetical protein